MRSEAIKPGDVIAGKYRVRTILGRSRGFLVEAFHTEFDQRVVIRVLSPAICDDKEIERFRREARTLAKLESEHVARIIDVGTLPDGAFYLVRQYLEGIDLATHIKKSGPLPLQQAVLFTLQASEAVAQTHVHNIILRELQPSQLFLAQRIGGAPVVKVIDFGTAKLMREAAAPTAGLEHTATAMFGLSPYSSPELVRKAKSVDVRTDIWSLGAILYQLLAGRPPFDGEMAMLMLQIIKEAPVPLSHLRRDIPAEMDAIIGWSLAKDVDGRFANVHAFAHSLTPYASAEGQVLIQRIGEITNAAKQQKQRAAYSAPPPAAAAPARRGGAISGADIDDDAPTFVEVTDDDTGVNALAGGGKESLDRTMFMGADYVPPSPGPPGGGASRSPAGPPPPAFAGASAGASAQPAVPPAKSSLLGPSLQLDAGRRQAMPSWSDTPGGVAPGQGSSSIRPGSTVPFASEAAAPAVGGSSPDVGESPPGGRSKRNLVLAIAGACIGLSLIGTLIIVFSGGESTSETPTPASSEEALVAPAPSGTAVAAPTMEPTGAPVASASPEPSASAGPEPSPSPSPPSQPTVVAQGSPAAPATGAQQPRPPSGPSGPATPKPTAAPTAAPVATAAPAPDSGAMGTLVAVAVGGSCAFSVNGASKGSGATVKVPLKPGTYSVSCKPVSGATKSRSVTVTSGGTAMAMFKL